MGVRGSVPSEAAGATSSSPRPSTSLMSARSVLPCDTTSTVSPCSSAGAISSRHARATRTLVSLRLSLKGTLEPSCGVGQGGWGGGEQGRGV